MGRNFLEINGFMSKGVFTELDSTVRKNRLPAAEIAKSHLDGQSTDINDVLGLMARLEKLHSRVAEPGVVQGQIPVFLPLNTTGDEAYTTCYYTFDFNGLGLAGQGEDLILLRSETRPELKAPERRWNRNLVLATQLFRLGYLKPDPIMRQYRDRIGTQSGHAVLEPKSNTLIVTDTAKSVSVLARYIDGEILEAMGTPAPDLDQAPAEPRPPSLGAIATRDNIHFYLMTFARINQIPLASLKNDANTRLYPEAGLWTTEQGYRTLESEYKRVNTFYQLARQTRGEGWVESNPDRTLTPAEQRAARSVSDLSPRYRNGQLRQRTRRARRPRRPRRSARIAAVSGLWAAAPSSTARPFPG